MERIEDLQLKGLRIYQDTEKFCFGTDGVLLGRFAQPKKGDRILDIGTGTGIVTFIMYGLQQQAQYTGIDLQSEMVALANKSKELNRIGNMLFQTANLKEYDQKHSFDVVVCNPPYEKLGTGKQRGNENERVSRYEVEADFGDIAACAFRNLCPGGRFYFIHKAERLTEISRILHANGMELKTIRPVLKDLHSLPRLLLLEAREGGKEYLHWKEPVVLYDENGKLNDYGALL